MVSVAAFIATTALPPIFGAAASWADRPKGYPAVGTASPSAALVFKRSRLVHDILRSEEHTSELQSLMRISYAVFCLKQKNPIAHTINTTNEQLIIVKNKHIT